MNKAQATVRMSTVQMTSILETHLRESARQMLVVALRAEADEYIKQAVGERDQNGRQLVVGNGLSRERTLQTSVGTMPIRQPRVDDGRDGYHFTNAILPRYRCAGDDEHRCHGGNTVAAWRIHHPDGGSSSEHRR